MDIQAAKSEQNLNFRTCCNDYFLPVVLKGGIFVVSVLSKIPSIPIALQLPLGPLFATVTAISYCKLETWAGFKIIDASLMPSEKNDSSNCVKCLSTTKKVFIIGIATILGLISLIPQGLAAAEYNTGYWKIPAGIVTLVAGSFFPIYSVQLSLNAFGFKKIQKTDDEKEVDKLRGLLNSVIQQNKKEFIKMSSSERNEAVTQRKVLSLGKSSSEISSLFQNYAPQVQNLETPSKIRGGVTLASSWIVGGALTLVFLAALTGYTYFQTTAQFKSPIAGGVTAALVLGTSFYLTGKSIIDTLGVIVGEIYDILTCSRTRTFAEKIAPISVFSSKIIGFIIDALSVGPTAVVFGNAFNQNIIEKYFFEVVMCSCVFLMLFTATLAFSEDFLIGMWKRVGGQSTKDAIQTLENYDILAQNIASISPKEVIEVFKALPTEVQAAMITHGKFNSEILDKELLLSHPEKEQLV